MNNSESKRKAAAIHNIDTPAQKHAKRMKRERIERSMTKPSPYFSMPALRGFSF